MNAKHHFFHDLMAVVSVTLGTVSWLDTVDVVVRILAGVIAIVVGLVTLYQRLKGRKLPPE